MFGQCLAQRRRLLGDIDQAFPNENLPLLYWESDGGSDPVSMSASRNPT